MKALLLYCVLAYVNADADLGQLLSGALLHLGPYDAVVKIGNLSRSYQKLESNDLLASRSAHQLIEEARRMFKEGFYTLPPLDPYFKQNLPPFYLESNDLVDLSGTVHIENLYVKGLSKFHLQLIEIRLRTGRVDLQFTVPNLNIDADLQAEILVADIIPVHLQGHLSLVLKDVSIIAAAQIEPTEVRKEVVYQIVAQHSLLHIGDVAFQFKGTELDAGIKQIGPDSVSSSEALSMLKNSVDRYIASLALKQANEVLTGATVNQVLAYLLPENVTR
ncbi:uncharacterized protein [Battus philenor]|uniref:uncharacterized protein n=1 Tax=Battus philenor TaxID=42288 RepID=UPI0035CEC1A5